jgi:hypothetical protein
MDQAEQWAARNERRIDELARALADHAALPWHQGFVPFEQELAKRLDRFEATLKTIDSRWIKALLAIIGLLLGILGALVQILLVAEKILQAKG